jgi:chaperonin GroEL (HSP60 family)
MAIISTMPGTQGFRMLKKGARRVSGDEARRSNIKVARLMEEMVKTTIGPRSMDKMIVSAKGEVKIADDGASILREIDNDPAGFRLVHPIAKSILQTAETVEKHVGDGTATTITLIGELLQEAQKLLEQKIHPSNIIHGYTIAAKKTLSLLGELSMKVSLHDEQTLEAVAKTAINGRLPEDAANLLAKISAEAVKRIAEKRDRKWDIDLDRVLIVKQRGGGLMDTILFDGVILYDNFIVLPTMPKRLEKVKVALIWSPIYLMDKEMKKQIVIRYPQQMKAFVDAEDRIFENFVRKVKETGARLLVCQKKDIDEAALHHFAKEGIAVVRRATEKEMHCLAAATKGKIVMDVRQLTKEDLGHADYVEERKYGRFEAVLVKCGKRSKGVSILLRGSEELLEVAERTLKSSLLAVRTVFIESRVLPGGGAIEIEVARRLRGYAKKFRGKEQLAIIAFASALESVPKILAENAGMDPIETISSLRAMHEQLGGTDVGVEALSRRLSHMFQERILDPLEVKKHIIKSAVDMATIILRIDDFMKMKRVRLALTGHS